MMPDKVREYKAELLGLEVPEEVQPEPAIKLARVEEPQSTAQKVIKVVVIVLAVLGALPVIGFLLLILMCAGG